MITWSNFWQNPDTIFNALTGVGTIFLGGVSIWLAKRKPKQRIRFVLTSEIEYLENQFLGYLLVIEITNLANENIFVREIGLAIGKRTYLHKERDNGSFFLQPAVPRTYLYGKDTCAGAPYLECRQVDCVNQEVSVNYYEIFTSNEIFEQICNDIKNIHGKFPEKVETLIPILRQRLKGVVVSTNKIIIETEITEDFAKYLAMFYKNNILNNNNKNDELNKFNPRANKYAQPVDKGTIDVSKQ